MEHSGCLPLFLMEQRSRPPSTPKRMGAWGILSSLAYFVAAVSGEPISEDGAFRYLNIQREPFMYRSPGADERGAVRSIAATVVSQATTDKFSNTGNLIIGYAGTVSFEHTAQQAMALRMESPGEATINVPLSELPGVKNVHVLHKLSMAVVEFFKEATPDQVEATTHRLLNTLQITLVETSIAGEFTQHDAGEKDARGDRKRANMRQRYDKEVRQEAGEVDEAGKPKCNETDSESGGRGCQLREGNPLTEEPLHEWVPYPSNDPRINDQWNLCSRKVGYKLHIDAKHAWENHDSTQSRVVIAVIDAGIHVKHPDLEKNIWINKGEIPGNGVDDDKNGYVDDINGWDMVDNTGNITKEKHGTHVAGIIGAVTNNKLGIAGVCPGAKIMALRVQVTTAMTFLATNYAIDNGAMISNHSYSYHVANKSSPVVEGYKKLLKKAFEHNHLIVHSVHNESTDTDDPSSPLEYPARLSSESPNLIIVASMQQNGTLAKKSNYGKTSVHLAAPGDKILSTCLEPDGDYCRMGGTSMATPHVSGVAGLVKSANNNLTALQIKSIILGTVQPLESLKDKTVTGGLLSAGNAVIEARKVGRENSHVTLNETLLAERQEAERMEAERQEAERLEMEKERLKKEDERLAREEEERKRDQEGKERVQRQKAARERQRLAAEKQAEEERLKNEKARRGNDSDSALPAAHLSRIIAAAGFLAFINM